MNNSGWTSNENPKTTDWEEHSAVADLSTGRRFKAVQEVPMKVQIDATSDTAIYIGHSKPGIATSEPYWRIKRIGVNDALVDISFANGTDTFTNIWDDRASPSMSYS